MDVCDVGALRIEGCVRNTDGKTVTAMCTITLDELSAACMAHYDASIRAAANYAAYQFNLDRHLPRATTKMCTVPFIVIDHVFKTYEAHKAHVAEIFKTNFESRIPRADRDLYDVVARVQTTPRGNEPEFIQNAYVEVSRKFNLCDQQLIGAAADVSKFIESDTLKTLTAPAAVLRVQEYMASSFRDADELQRYYERELNERAGAANKRARVRVEVHPAVYEKKLEGGDRPAPLRDMIVDVHVERA